MNFFIVDDSAPVRAMLANIIEDEDLGVVKGEAGDGSEVYSDELQNADIDVLLIDLLMPNRDGIETVREIAPSFKGKIIMVSQVETKDMIGEAYSLGVEYYITKPINRLEVVSVLKKVCEHLLLEKSIINIQKSLNVLGSFNPKAEPQSWTKRLPCSIVSAGKTVLLELGILAESGSKDLLDMLSIMAQLEKEGVRETPALKDLYEKIVEKRYGPTVPPAEVKKETKAGEQRVRRAIHQALEHIASLGLTDFANPKFENYSSKFFDYSQVRMKMMELESRGDLPLSHSRINIRKFIQALYMEAKQLQDQ
ncbi:response regulator [Mesobacillus zeae]|uniref:Response regulator n=1 Tax=Mesobacillus zeae TaxID=1917180 RepID=A0A398B6M2_9BACI|nr:response regulator [Mesobacillus zeae]RID84458.1 response regulator [Mesobacillus zeae]